MNKTLTINKCLWCNETIGNERRTKFCSGQHSSYYYQRPWLNKEYKKNHPEIPVVSAVSENPGEEVVKEG